jgi:hypothetical protein
MMTVTDICARIMSVTDIKEYLMHIFVTGATGFVGSRLRGSPAPPPPPPRLRAPAPPCGADRSKTSKASKRVRPRLTG